MIREEPERFFLPVNSGIMTQPEYNKIIGVPEDYKPKIKPWIKFIFYNNRRGFGVLGFWGFGFRV